MPMYSCCLGYILITNLFTYMANLTRLQPLLFSLFFLLLSLSSNLKAQVDVAQNEFESAKIKRDKKIQRKHKNKKRPRKNGPGSNSDSSSTSNFEEENKINDMHENKLSDEAYQKLEKNIIINATVKSHPLAIADFFEFGFGYFLN